MQFRIAQNANNIIIKDWLVKRQKKEEIHCLRSTWRKTVSEFVPTRTAKCQSWEQMVASESHAADATKVCVSSVLPTRWLLTTITTIATNIWMMSTEVTGDKWHFILMHWGFKKIITTFLVLVFESKEILNKNEFIQPVDSHKFQYE